MIKEDGNEEWVFESLDQSILNLNYPLIEVDNVTDRRVFWFTSYLAPIIWTLLIIVSALSFSLTNITICVYGCILTATNLLGYIKCHKNQKAKVQGFIFDTAKKNLSWGQMAKITEYASKYGQMK